MFTANARRGRRGRRDFALFDAEENFNKALRRARIERGEPPEGLSRKGFEAMQWAKGNSLKLAGFSLAAAALSVASMALLRNRRVSLPSELEPGASRRASADRTGQAA